jgi:DNA polymerase-1
MEKETLYLLDGTAILYRAHFALIRNPLINSRGMNTGAIFGVISSFLGFVNKFNPRHVIVSFDRKGPTFRHGMSELYKANRPPMPDELILQVEPVKQFFSDIGLPEISCEGFEADDILATLTEKYKNQYDIIIVTGDKDYSQLVQDGVMLYDPMKDLIIEREEVIGKYGIAPEQFVDYLAIVGDSSDNIPGVKGIGAVGAAKLLVQYQTLDGIYEHLDELAGKLKEKLQTDQANAYLSRELAQMILDAPISLPTVETTHFQKADLLQAMPILDQYELPSLKKRLLNLLPKNAMPNSIVEENQDIIQTEGKSNLQQESEAKDQHLTQGDLFGEEFGSVILPTNPDELIQADRQQLFEPVLIDNTELFAMLCADLQQAKLISIDTETTSLDPLQADLVGISLCVSAEKAYYLPVGHAMYDNLDKTEVLKQIALAVYRDGEAPAVLTGHNLKYDLTIFKTHGWQVQNPLFDSMLAAYILDPGINQYSLDACSQRELHYQMQPISQLIGTGKNQITFDLVEVNKACFYSTEDAWVAFRLQDIYQTKLQNTGLNRIYEQIELPLLTVLEAMESQGVHIDTGILGSISHLINLQLKDLTEKIYQAAGYQFNINSTQQLGKLLFDDMKLPVHKKTKTGYSTDTTVLEELAAEYEIAALAMEYRQLTKLESTYVSALPKLINPVTGRVHSSFNQTIASTGRLSSTNPNLQNIPIRTALGREIRKAFCAPDADTVILSADYSQIELRLLAMLSHDPVLLEAFATGVDIHRQTAAYINHKALGEVTTEERRAAKVINFGILYGMGQQKLSRELGITQQAAKEIISHYFEQFHSIRDFIQTCYRNARQKHYAETIFGRRLYLPYINSTNQKIKAESERVSVNMPIQGTAADLIKLAMIDIHHKIKTDKEIVMILQVHDELVFEVKKAAIERALPLIKTAMSDALPAEYRSLVKLEVEAGYGKSWFDAHA